LSEGRASGQKSVKFALLPPEMALFAELVFRRLSRKMGWGLGLGDWHHGENL